jgi:hypothetical protein
MKGKEDQTMKKAKTLDEVKTRMKELAKTLDFVDDAYLAEIVSNEAPALFPIGADRFQKLCAMLRVAYALGFVEAESEWVHKAG